MTTTTPLVRVDTTVNTDVKYSKVFALAFVKNEGVTGVFTEDQLRPFVIPKLSDATLFGSAIVQLDSLATGHNYHSGKGDETFTGLLTKVFSNGIDESNPTADDLSAGIDVYFVTMDGVNETAMRSVFAEVIDDFYTITKSLTNLQTEVYDTSWLLLSVDVAYENNTSYVSNEGIHTGIPSLLNSAPSQITPSMVSEIKQIYNGDVNYQLISFFVMHDNRIFVQMVNPRITLSKELTGWTTHFNALLVGNASLQIKHVLCDNTSPLIILSDGSFHTTTTDTTSAFTVESTFSQITRDESLADSRLNFKPSTLPTDTEYTYIGSFYRHVHAFKASTGGLYGFDPELFLWVVYSLDTSSLSGTYDFTNTYEMYLVFAIGTTFDSPKICVFRNNNDHSDKLLLSGTYNTTTKQTVISTLSTGTDYDTIQTLIQKEDFIVNTHSMNYLHNTNGLMYAHVNENPSSIGDYSVYVALGGGGSGGVYLQGIDTIGRQGITISSVITNYYTRHSVWPTYVHMYPIINTGNMAGLMLGH